ncbi:MAG: hypothetical protein RL654_1006 [Pseudomonadota bacterium]|jgi:hypothetical protein
MTVRPSFAVATPRRLAFATAVLLSAGLAACSSTSAPMGVMGVTSSTSMTAASQTGLPTPVQVPAGHRIAWETVGVGQITYECRAKAGTPGAFEWVFVGPDAELRSRSGMKLGRYFGPPATWASDDGSALTGTQIGLVPAAAGNIPLQLVKANPATGRGVLEGVSYIQRLATRGGVAPAMACGEGQTGQRQVVPYQADYIFWKPGA